MILERVIRYVNEQIITKADQLRSNPDEEIKVAIFGHGVAFGCFVRNLLDSDPSMTWKFQLPNTSITEISFKPGHYNWSLRCLGITPHLQ